MTGTMPTDVLRDGTGAGPSRSDDDVTDGAALDARALELDAAHVFHSWSAQATLTPLALAGGRGSTVWDHAGNRYLDFSSQLVNVNIGYGHPAVVRAIQDQAAALATIGPATANLVRGEAARRIAGHAPSGMEKVFFTNGGADAIENAIRMARLHTGRRKVVSTYRSYHGNTGAAINATGDWRRLPNEHATGHVHVFGPFLYRTEFWATSPEQEAERALQHLRRTVEVEGPDTIAAILLETIPGTAGVLMPPPGYLEGARALADQHGILLILDEVMAGFGRTGEWFALDAYGVRPDLLTFAKGVNSGYVPMGGVIIDDAVAASFDERVFPGGLTYSGHPLAAASVVAALDAMADEGIVANAKRIGTDVLGPGLQDLAERHPVVGEARGTGVFWALELVADAETRAPLPAAELGLAKKELMARGVLPFTVDNRIHVVPPCVVTDDEVRQALVAYDEVLTLLDGRL